MLKNDEQLIADYLEGNEEALTTLVDRYLNDVYAFAFNLTHDLQAAEDIAQDSLIKAWTHIRGYRPGNSFKGWLFAIARNTAIDFLRKKKELVFSAFENKAGENILLETLADQKLLPDVLLSRAEDTRYLQLLLEQLNPSYREVLTLRYEDDFTFKEIGELLKKPLHTVKSQHRRALVALQRLFRAEPI